MKNLIITHGFKLALLTFLLLLFHSNYSYSQRTISSSQSGGVWQESNTWIGGSAPTEYDHVIINGNVVINGSTSCQSLTISPNALLHNNTYYSPTLTVKGKITNNGSITNHPSSGYSFYLLLLGDIENNGIWQPRQTTIDGSNHSISQGYSKKFEGDFRNESENVNLILQSNIEFAGNTLYLNTSSISANSYQLSFTNCIVDNGIITSNGIIHLDNTAISEITINGNYTLTGNSFMRYNNIFNDTFTNGGTLQNDSYYSSTLYVNGTIINNGTIQNHPTTGYKFYMDVNGNIENNGNWLPHVTYLSSQSDQYLKQSDNKVFNGYFETTDSIGDIILRSDISLEDNTWEFNRSLLKTNGFKLNTKNYLLENGKILSNETMVLDDTRISSITINGNYKIDGMLYVRYGNFFNNSVTILDTLTNDDYYSSTLSITGEIINDGVIINHPTTGYSFYLEVDGNIVNNKEWNPRATTLTSASNQYISQSVNTNFEGTFHTNDSIGDILLNSDVSFLGNTWNFNKSKLLTNGYNFNTLDCHINTGTIESDDVLKLDNTTISTMKFRGNYTLDGKLRIQYSNELYGVATVIDTIHNDSYYSSTLEVKGEIINKGVIINHPQTGYSFYINAYDKIINEGIWSPRNTEFSANGEHQISQMEGKVFEGQFTSKDSLCAITMESDVAFRNNTFKLNNSTLKTNGYKLISDNQTFENGKIVGNDTLSLYNSWFAAINVFGDTKIAGKLWNKYSNNFNGNTTIIDTIYNSAYYSPKVNFNGDLLNNGIIANHPSTGYTLDLRVSGNITNNKTIRIDDLYLAGKNERSIIGLNSSGISADIHVEDAIILTGQNTLPNLNFVSNETASCTIKKDAILTLFASTDEGKITNNGRITITNEVDNSNNKTYNFFAASASTKTNTALNQLTIDNYGKQQHPNAKGTINSWWRIRNTPQVFNDTLNWVKLKYHDEDLNGSVEDSLKVFYSPNAGLSWKKIKNEYTIDTEDNVVNIPEVPSFGHFLLSSSPLGITSFQPLLETAEPRKGGNSGQITMYLFGAGFKSTSKVILRSASLGDIVAEDTWLTDGFGESMTARFDLQNKPLGIYDVVVETSGATSQTLKNHFTLLNGERSDPWSNITGRDRFLLNRWQTFKINYGNTANTDALSTVLVFVINDLPNLEVVFPDLDVILPDPITNLGEDFTRFSELELYYVTDSLSGYEGQQMRVYPFIIPYISAGSTNDTRVRVKLTGNGTLNMDSWILDPLFEEIDYSLKSAKPMPTEVRACITAAAMKAWYGAAVSMGSSAIPGLACWGVIDKTVDPVGYITPESLKPESKKTWGSWLWSGVSIMGSVVQCGASFVPGIGTAVSMGISLVNTTIDMKDGYDATEGCWRKFRKKSKNKLKSNGVSSFDPNEIVGPHGYDEDNYISKEGKFNYTIFFENKKTAGASALEVFVYDTLDVTKYNLETFSFNSITFADTSVQIQQAAKEFQVMVDMYPQRPLIVQVHGKLDSLTGVVSWDFHSLDRMTMELTEDPDMGFLLPNKVSPEGEGNVTFSCELHEDVAHGDTISNYATIVFDFNKPIVTNIHSNLIDDMSPASAVDPLNPIQEDSVFTVSWTGDDLGSKIFNYSIFVSENDSAFVLWKSASYAGEEKFIGKNNHKYAFFSVATDSIGFVESFKEEAEATTIVEVQVSVNELSNKKVFSVYPNPAQQKCTIELNVVEGEELTLEIEDVIGRKFQSLDRQFSKTGITKIELDISSLSDGIYFIQINGENVSQRQKLIIKK